MKTIYSYLIATLLSISAFAQMMNVPKDTLIKNDKAYLTNIIKKSPYIFEGTLVKKGDPFYVKGKGVFTTNVIQVNKILRGNDLKIGTVEILTEEGDADGGDGWIHMESHEIDGLPNIKLSLGQPVLLFCIPADSSIKQKPEKIITTDNTICLQPKEWHTTAAIYFPKTDASISWLNLSFKNRKELYDFLSKHSNIKIPKKPH